MFFHEYSISDEMQKRTLSLRGNCPNGERVPTLPEFRSRTSRWRAPERNVFKTAFFPRLNGAVLSVAIPPTDYKRFILIYTTIPRRKKNTHRSGQVAGNWYTICSSSGRLQRSRGRLQHLWPFAKFLVVCIRSCLLFRGGTATKSL